MICPHCKKEVFHALSAVELVLRQRDLERVEARMGSIRNSYSDHQTWDATDAKEFKILKARREELKAILGFIV